MKGKLCLNHCWLTDRRWAARDRHFSSSDCHFGSYYWYSGLSPRRPWFCWSSTSSSSSTTSTEMALDCPRTRYRRSRSCLFFGRSFIDLGFHTTSIGLSFDHFSGFVSSRCCVCCRPSFFRWLLQMDGVCLPFSTACRCGEELCPKNLSIPAPLPIHPLLQQGMCLSWLRISPSVPRTPFVTPLLLPSGILWRVCPKI